MCKSHHLFVSWPSDCICCNLAKVNQMCPHLFGSITMIIASVWLDYNDNWRENKPGVNQHRTLPWQSHLTRHIAITFPLLWDAFDWISPPGEGEMVVFGGRGPTPWRGPQPQTQAQHPHQSSWPGPTTSASGDCTNQLLSCVSIYSFSSGYHHPCRQSSTSRPSQLWQFGWVPFSYTGVMLKRTKC